MSQSITHYVEVNIVLSGTGTQPAGFGTPCFFYEHAIDSPRLAGPFLSVAAVIAAGHVSGSPAADYAAAHFAQSPRAKQMYVGRLDSGDTDLTEGLTAIVAAAPGAFYCLVAGEDHRDADSIIELAEFTETLPKIALAQSNDASLLSGEGPTWTALVGGTPADGNYDLIFTGYGLPSPVTVRVTRSTTPATNPDLAAGLDAALDTEADTGGDLEDIVDPASISTNSATVTFKILDGLASGAVTTAAPSGATITATETDPDIGSQLFDAQYTRTALIYHPTDTDYLSAAWAARCLSFDLDVQKGAWSGKRLNGQTGTTLTDAQVTNLRNVNCNYFSDAQMSSGVSVSAFTAQGWFPSGDAAAGRRIDVTISLDWLKARIEEAITSVWLREPNWILFDDAGMHRYAAAVQGVMELGIKAQHLVPFVVPEGEDNAGLLTPALFVPLFSEITTTQRTARTFSFTGIAYLAAGIEKVVFTVNVQQ